MAVACPGLPGPEGLVFGAGDHLPDAHALEQFDPRVDPQLSLTTWRLHQHPEAILRFQRGTFNDAADCWELAREGIQHLRELQDRGIPVPPQRYIVGPDLYTRAYRRLYAVSDYLPGRNLTHEPHDAPYARTVINGTAGYILRRATGEAPTPRFLFDTGYPWQHTVLENPDAITTNIPGSKFCLHDTGLEFADLNNRRITRGTMEYIGLHLLRWTRKVGIEQSDELRQLLGLVETRPRRWQRIVKELAKPALRYPKEPPPNLIGQQR